MSTKLEITVPVFYKPYIEKASKYNSIIEGLELEKEILIEFYNSLPQSKLEYRYATDKWTPKDILLHLIDAERIFTYRALRIARSDKTNLPGFEEGDYVREAKANNRSLESLIEEFLVVRQGTLSLFKTFQNEDLLKNGIANDNEISVQAIGFITIGHSMHHLQVIKERYL